MIIMWVTLRSIPKPRYEWHAIVTKARATCVNSRLLYCTSRPIQVLNENVSEA